MVHMRVVHMARNGDAPSVHDAWVRCRVGGLSVGPRHFGHGCFVRGAGGVLSVVRSGVIVAVLRLSSSVRCSRVHVALVGRVLVILLVLHLLILRRLPGRMALGPRSLLLLDRGGVDQRGQLHLQSVDGVRVGNLQRVRDPLGPLGGLGADPRDPAALALQR